MIQPVILSGGEGKRLWPLSRPDRPKQFLVLTGEETLLHQLQAIAAGSVLVIEQQPVEAGAARNLCCDR